MATNYGNICGIFKIKILNSEFGIYSRYSLNEHKKLTIKMQFYEHMQFLQSAKDIHL